MSERYGKTMHVSDLLRRAMKGVAARTPEELAEAQAEYDRAAARAYGAAEKRMADTFGLFLGRCGVPPRIVQDASSGTLRDTRALSFARTWMEGREGHLVLSGHPGAGKSVAAAWTLRRSTRTWAAGGYGELEWDDNGALWVSFGNLCRLSDFHEVDQMLLRRAYRVPFLVLDDVGTGDAEAMSPRDKQRLEELADQRDAPGRRTVWTTNLSVRGGEGQSDFARYIGPRVYSRVARSVRAADCGAVDLRREGGR